MPTFFMRIWESFRRGGVAGSMLAGTALAAAVPPPIDLGIEAEHFEFAGDWAVVDQPLTSGGKCLLSGERRALPAATAIVVPRADRYHLWVRALDFPQDRPGTRRFSVSVGGQLSREVFGDSGKTGFTWEPGGTFTLPAGRTLLSIHAQTGFARADAILLTTDPNFRPTQALAASGRHRRILPEKITSTEEVDQVAPIPVTSIEDSPVAEISNEHLRITFVPAIRGGQRTVCPRVAVKGAQGWEELPADPASELYTVVDAGSDAQLHHAGFFPRWQTSRRAQDTVTVTLSGVSLKTARAGNGVIWQAGDLARLLPRAAVAESGRVRLEFDPAPVGRLSAEWELRPGEKAARVRLTFIPAAAGQYAVGYHLFFRRPLAGVKEILLPMMWHRHRLPERPRTLLDPFTPTPLALAETVDAGASRCWALAGDPAEIPFEWPQPSRPHYGLAIRDHAGAVHPSIYGPVPGTEAARRPAGGPLQLSFRVLVQTGDWYAGFRTAADEINGLRDYRRNVRVSLTAALLNMIDLLKDDDRGGWWERGKGFYQIETKNGVTHASPLLLLSLYRLTGDEDLYRRRALPAMEYALSRRSPHFSPLPHDTGRYDPGGMDGPIKLFGTATFGGFWEMTGRSTPAFAEIALPRDAVRPTAGYSHGQPFDDWLARYEITGDRTDLAHAQRLADAYIAQQITRPPATELGPVPFFFISFVPAWEGLLRLYEATGERRYLDASAFGARQLMTGLWTQPAIPPGEVTVHPGGQYKGDTMGSWRGAAPYRLGTPRRAHDTPERRVPAWLVSNVGLGFEQPSTYKGSGPGRLIFQMGWAADFLRLARHTGDPAFETCARNAVLGRWGNYPGYYATGFTDLPLNPRYPYVGPDVTDFYYHHIAPHLAWTLDFLVAEAELRSGGRIAFPSQRQNGYAYFDSRVYGHAPGKIFDQADVWLWPRRDLVAIDNPQLNFLTARRGDSLFLILLNEHSQAETARIRFSATALGLEPAQLRQATPVLAAGTDRPRALRGETLEVQVAARGLEVWRLDGIRADVATHRVWPRPAPAPIPTFVTAKSSAPNVEARGAALQVGPGKWDAFLWCTASPHQARRVTFFYQTGSEWQQWDDVDYPFEFSLPVASAGTACRFYIVGHTPEGTEFRTPEATLGAGRNSIPARP